MDIQAVFSLKTPGGDVRIFVNGTAQAPDWCAEFSDWQYEHIKIENIEGEDGDKLPLQMFSEQQLINMKSGLLLAARWKSAINPTLAANLRKLLNLPEHEPNKGFIE